MTSRADDAAAELELPPLDPEAQVYLDLLWEAGPTAPSGYGAVGLPWSELAAWIAASGHRLRPREMAMIRRLSQAYASAQHEMRAHDAPAPWSAAPDDTDEKAQKVENSIGALFGALAKKQGPRA